MKIVCECGKRLHMDECGFTNPHYQDFVFYLCPYCGSVTSSFIRPNLKKLPSWSSADKVSDEEMATTLQTKADKLVERMKKLNDEVWTHMEKLSNAIKEIDDGERGKRFFQKLQKKGFNVKKFSDLTKH